MEVVKEISPKYSHLIGFFYVNNTLFWHRKRVLGVTWDELPSMAFNFLGGEQSKVVAYPRGREISKKAMFDFFDELFTGKKNSNTVQPSDFIKPPSDFSKVKNDTEIEPFLLNNTLITTRHNFSEIVYSEGYDVIVFLYTTEVIHSGQRSVAVQVNLMADTLSKLKQAFP